MSRPWTVDLMDQVETDFHGVAASKGDFARRRAKIRRNMTRAAAGIWYSGDFAWTMVTGTVSVLANADIVLPSTVESLAKEGGVWITSPARRPPLRWIPPHRYYDLVTQHAKTDEPQLYTQITTAKDGVTGDPNHYLLLYPINDATRTFRYVGKGASPVLVDSVNDNDDMWMIPHQWRQTLLYEWTVLYEMKDSANLQARTDQEKIVADWLEKMQKAERPGRNAPHNLAPYGRRRGGRGGGLYV